MQNKMSKLKYLKTKNYMPTYKDTSKQMWDSLKVKYPGSA